MLKKNKRILFIHNKSENLGIEYLSSVLKLNGHDVRLLFDPDIFNSDVLLAIQQVIPPLKILSKIDTLKKKLIKKVIELTPDIVCFSIYTDNFLWIKSIAKEIKKINNNIKIIVGGYHTTSLPEEVMKYDCFDYAIIGEGEYALVELINNIDDFQSIKGIKNVVYKNKDEIIINPVREYIYDLDLLPLPDKLLFYNKVPQFEESYIIMTSRGCPYNCFYCYNNMLKKVYSCFKNHLRYRSVENVIEELKIYKKRGIMKSVFWEDDVFTINKKRLAHLMEEYKKHINLPFWFFVHPKNLDKEMVDILSDGGAWMGNMGMQSGSSRIRKDIYGRIENEEEILKSSYLLKNKNIKLALDIILGAPTETEKDLYETLKILLKIKPERLNTYWIVYYPKTKILNIALQKKYFTKEAYNKLKQGKVEMMSDGGTVLTNKKIYRYYEFLYIIYTFFNFSSEKKTINTIVKILPFKGFFKRFFELLIAIRNNDYKLFYLFKYLTSKKKVP